MTDTGIAAVEKYLAEAAKLQARAAEAQARADAELAEQQAVMKERQRRFDEQLVAAYNPQHAERLRDEATERLHETLRSEPWYAALVDAQAANVRPNRQANDANSALQRLGRPPVIFEPSQREVIFVTVLSQLVSHDAALINGAEADQLEQQRNAAT